jgi:selenophosphate synthase
MNPQYKFDPETVGPLLVGILNEAVQEIEDFGKENSCPMFRVGGLTHRIPEMILLITLWD